MKTIVLAKKSHRIFAALIDMVFVIVTALLLFGVVVFPLTLNTSEYYSYNKKIFDEYSSSGLFLIDEEKKSYIELPYFSSSFSTIESLSNNSIKHNDKEYPSINAIKIIYDFYTNEDKIKHFFEHDVFNLENFKVEILGINNPSSDSCITSFDEVNFKITSSKDAKSITFIMEKLAALVKGVVNSKIIKSLTESRDRIMLLEFLYLFPVLAFTSFVFIYLIPLLSKGNKSIGKKIFHLIILTDEGYRFKKSKLIIRWLAYYFTELCFGIITLGGGILISYTMFLFKKKRRCLHDVIAKTVVADERQSIYFDSKEEEQYFIEKKRVSTYA